MDAVVTALSINTSAFLGQLAVLAPLVGIAIIVSFGLGILSAIIEGLNNGKATMAHVGRSSAVDGVKSGKYHG